eukprot:2559337-Pyramimonas_sp.AAC.1
MSRRNSEIGYRFNNKSPPFEARELPVHVPGGHGIFSRGLRISCPCHWRAIMSHGRGGCREGEEEGEDAKDVFAFRAPGCCAFFVVLARVLNAKRWHYQHTLLARVLHP